MWLIEQIKTDLPYCKTFLLSSHLSFLGLVECEWKKSLSDYSETWVNFLHDKSNYILNSSEMSHAVWSNLLRNDNKKCCCRARERTKHRQMIFSDFNTKILSQVTTRCKLRNPGTKQLRWTGEDNHKDRKSQRVLTETKLHRKPVMIVW